MAAPYEREITQLHVFFVQWFDAHLPQTETAFRRFADVTAPSFTLISPQGHLTRRDDLVKGLYQAHGQRPGWRIWIENAVLRQADAPLALLTYEEWQAHEGITTARLSTVLFQQVPASDATPNGLLWLHVHETWLPNHAPKG